MQFTGGRESQNIPCALSCLSPLPYIVGKQSLMVFYVMLSRYTYCRARNLSIGLRFLFIIKICFGVKASEHAWRKTPQKMLGVPLSTSSKTIPWHRYTTTTVPHLSRPGDITSRSSLQYVSLSVPGRTYDGVALTGPGSSRIKTSILPAVIACAHGLLVAGGFLVLKELGR